MVASTNVLSSNTFVPFSQPQTFHLTDSQSVAEAGLNASFLRPAREGPAAVEGEKRKVCDAQPSGMKVATRAGSIAACAFSKLGMSWEWLMR